MTFVLEVFDDEGDSDSKPFKTLAGAVRAGIRALEKKGFRPYGYQAPNRIEGEGQNRRRIVAEWKDRGRQLARVWT